MIVISMYFIYFGVIMLTFSLIIRTNTVSETCQVMSKPLCEGDYVAIAILIISLLVFIINSCFCNFGYWFKHLRNDASTIDMEILTARIAVMLEEVHMQRQLKAASGCRDEICEDSQCTSCTTIPSSLPYCTAISYPTKTTTRFSGSFTNSHVTDTPEIPLVSPSETTNASDERGSTGSSNDFDGSSAGSESNTMTHSEHQNTYTRPASPDTAGLSLVDAANSETSPTSDRYVSSGDLNKPVAHSSQVPVNVTASDNPISSADSNIPVVSANSGIPVIFTTRGPKSANKPGLPVAYTLATRIPSNIPVVSANSSILVDNPTTSSSDDIPTVSATSGIPVVFTLGSSLPVASTASALNNWQKGGKVQLPDKPVGVVKPNSCDKKIQQGGGTRQAKTRGEMKQILYVRCCCEQARAQERKRQEEREKFIASLNRNREESGVENMDSLMEWERLMTYFENITQYNHDPLNQYEIDESLDDDYESDIEISVDSDEADNITWMDRDGYGE